MALGKYLYHILGACKCYTILGKKGSADVIKLRTLGWDHLGLSEHDLNPMTKTL